MFGEIAEQAAVISATPEEFPALEPVGWVSDENPKEDALATAGKEGFVPLADAGSPELEVFAERPSRPGVEHMLDLAEAEQLLQALESQSREPVPAGTAERAHGDAPSSVEADASGTALGEVAPVEELDADEESGSSVYRQPTSRRHRHRSSHSRQRGWRRVVRWGIRLAVILAVACIAAGGYLKFRSMFASPKETFERARSLQMAGRYGEASGAYQRFAQSNPNDPQRAEAEFLSAYCLQLAPADSFDAKQTNNAGAHDLFARFIADNPAHAKVPRARVRMGILSFEIGRYEEAIEILQDPTLPMSDPEGALPALRTLARARWKLGQYPEATSAYQQAASLTGNYTADQDYEELGDLSRWQADRTENAEQRRRLQMDAVDNWAKALRMPTADPAAKGRVREKRRWLLEQLGLPADEAGQGYQAAGPAKTVPASGPPASLERTAAAATTAEQENAPSPSAPSLEQNPAAPDSATTSTSGAPDPNAEAHYPGQPVAPEKTEPNATAPGRSPS
jgi:TolA-binding protein